MPLTEEQTRTLCEQFVKKTNSHEKIWGLKSKEGWAICLSQDDDEIQVMPFWSSQSNAEKYAIDEWRDYQPTAIQRDEFIFDWLNGMASDDVMVGLDWTDDVNEREVDPTLLAEIF